MNNTNYEQDNSRTIAWTFWICSCFVFPPIAAFFMGYFIVSGIIGLIRYFIYTLFSVVSPDATEVHVSGYTNPIQSFSTNFYDPDRK
jgi:hypothetical protein